MSFEHSPPDERGRLVPDFNPPFATVGATQNIPPTTDNAGGTLFSGLLTPLCAPATEIPCQIIDELSPLHPRLCIPCIRDLPIDKVDGACTPVPAALDGEENGIQQEKVPLLHSPSLTRFDNNVRLLNGSNQLHTSPQNSPQYPYEDKACPSLQKRNNFVEDADVKHQFLAAIMEMHSTPQLSSPSLSENLPPQTFVVSRGRQSGNQGLSRAPTKKSHSSQNLMSCPEINLAVPSPTHLSKEMSPTPTDQSINPYFSPLRHTENERATTPRVRPDLKNLVHASDNVRSQEAGALPEVRTAPVTQPTLGCPVILAPRDVSAPSHSHVECELPTQGIVNDFRSPYAQPRGSGFTHTLVLPPLDKSPLSRDHYHGYGPFASQLFGLPLSSRWCNPPTVQGRGFMRSDPALYKLSDPPHTYLTPSIYPKELSTTSQMPAKCMSHSVSNLNNHSCFDTIVYSPDLGL